mgnify:CR=1 FL=1
MRTRIKDICFAEAKPDFLWTNPQGKKIICDCIVADIKRNKKENSSFENGVINAINEWRKNNAKVHK